MPSGKFHFEKCYLAIDGTNGTPVDLSAYVRSVDISFGRAELEKSCANDVGIARMAGLYDWSMQITLMNDFAAGTVDATLFDICNSGYEGTVSFRPDSAAQGATNPTFAGEGMLFDYPLSLSHGEPAEVTFTIKGSDGAALTRTAT